MIRAARASGVARIAALSGLDADPCSPFCYGYTERLLTGSGCLVSIARASIYSEFFAGFLARARAGGQVRLPAADGRISLVCRADVARCLAALAARPAAATTTSPALSPRPGCRLSLGGTPVGHRAGLCQYYARRALCGDGYRREDPWWIYAYSTMVASIRKQRWAAVSDEVRRLTGCSPVPVRETLASCKTA
ncbi:MAG TPA: hypothetical protein VFO01_19365 [Trebonia sp.]|nr:hypothetical protein [Trebonia sp.]